MTASCDHFLFFAFCVVLIILTNHRDWLWLVQKDLLTKSSLSLPCSWQHFFHLATKTAFEILCGSWLLQPSCVLSATCWTSMAGLELCGGFQRDFPSRAQPPVVPRPSSTYFIPADVLIATLEMRMSGQNEKMNIKSYELSSWVKHLTGGCVPASFSALLVLPLCNMTLCGSNKKRGLKALCTNL